jgi:hypothetical protein
LSVTIECGGAPRDIGRDQGRACAATLRARRERRPGGAHGGSRLRRPGGSLARDLARHLPHQAETLDALARAARVPLRWLLDELAAEFAGAFGDAAPLVGFEGPGGLSARGIEGEWLVRRSRPEGLFASVEVTRPWLSAALAGVNERGLAVAAVGATGGRPACEAPAALLAQDCLERFEETEAAVEWCLGRPGGGRAALLLSDAGGAAAVVETSGAERRLRRAVEGLLVSGGWATHDAALGASLRAERPGEPAALAARLPAPVVVLAPAERTLWVAGERFSP